MLGLSVLCLLACAPSPEANVERLEGSPEQREAARQELLLAKERAIPPLLTALADPQRHNLHPDAIEVLAGLLTRVDDPRISDAMRVHLTDTDDASVRARICYFFGLYMRTEAAPELLAALADNVADVRLGAMIALGRMEFTAGA